MTKRHARWAPLQAWLVALAVAGFPWACAETAPTFPDTVLPVCEEPGSAPLRFSWPDMPCPSADDVAAIRREIAITFKDPPWSPVVCRAGEGSLELTYVEERLYSALSFMRTVRFDAALPWTTLSLYEWFRTAIQGIVVETGDRSYCCSPAKVIHAGLQPQASTSLWGRTADSMWVSGLVHEARHADTGVPHTCRTDQTKDGRVFDLGAYGVQNLLMVWIAEHSDASPEMREWNRWTAKGHKLSAFCEECANAHIQVWLEAAPVVFGFRSPVSTSRCAAD